MMLKTTLYAYLDIIIDHLNLYADNSPLKHIGRGGRECPRNKEGAKKNSTKVFINIPPARVWAKVFISFCSHIVVALPCLTIACIMNIRSFCRNTRLGCFNGLPVINKQEKRANSGKLCVYGCPTEPLALKPAIGMGGGGH